MTSPLFRRGVPASTDEQLCWRCARGSTQVHVHGFSTHRPRNGRCTRRPLLVLDGATYLLDVAAAGAAAGQHVPSPATPGQGESRANRFDYLPGHHRRRCPPYLRFWTGHTSDCWIWLGARNPKGYGVTADGRGGCALAHRVYYEQAKGPIPQGLPSITCAECRPVSTPSILRP